MVCRLVLLCLLVCVFGPGAAAARSTTHVTTEFEVDLKAASASQARALAITALAPRRAIASALVALGAEQQAVDALALSDIDVLDVVIDYDILRETLQDTRYIARLRYRLRPGPLGALLSRLRPQAD